MEISKSLYVKNREEWRSWLDENHKSEKRNLAGFYKKHTGIPCVKYDDAVEEALCFGWIDSLVKRLDEKKYCQKFSVRKKNSKWSESNKVRIIKLVKGGKMTGAGFAAFLNVPEVASLLDNPDNLPLKKRRKKKKL